MTQNNHGMSVSPGLRSTMDRGERARRNLKAIASVLGRSNRIITGEDISMVVAEKRLVSMDTPGWTDGETIWLNGPNIREKFLKQSGDQSGLILALKGVNYHELAHVLYTPKSQTEISQKVWREHNQNRHLGIWYAFNLLEDLRAEMLMVTEFSTVINYFTNTVSKWILEHPANTLDSVWPLLSGRYYLPAELRRSARDAFAMTHGKKVADHMTEIASQYLRLLYPKDTSKGWLLIRELYTLLNSLRGVAQDEQIYLQPPTGVHHDPDASKGGFKGDGKQQVRRTKAIAEDRDELLDELEKEAESVFDSSAPEVEAEIVEEDDSDNDEAVGSGGGGDEDTDETDTESVSGGSGQESSDESDASDAGLGQGGQNTETNDDDNSDEDADPNSTTQSGGDGVGTKPADIYEQGKVRDELLDAVKEAQKEALDSEDLQEDLKNVQESVRHELDKEVKHVDHYQGSFKDVPATGSDKNSVAQMVRHLDDLRIDLEAVWIGQQATGHLNVRDAMSAQFGDLDIFDVWEEGSEEEASTEIVILLDLSPSMEKIMGVASRTMWMLKRALDEAGITTTVLGYADNWSVLYQPHDKAKKDLVRLFPYEGLSTIPDGALEQAAETLRGSRATNRILISITDGVWRSNSDSVRRSVMAVRNLPGSHTLMVNVDSDNSWLKKADLMKPNDLKLCHHQKGYYLGSIEHIVPIVESLVTDIMREVSSASAARYV